MALAADAMALAAVVRAAQLCTRGKGQLGLAEPPTDFAHSQAAARSVWCCIWLIQAQKRADVSGAMASVAPARRLRHAHANLGGMCRSPSRPNRARRLAIRAARYRCWRRRMRAAASPAGCTQAR